MILTKDLIVDTGTLISKSVDGSGYTHVFIYGPWRLFYSLEGDASPADTTSSNHKGVPDYVVNMLYKFETAYILLVESFGLKDILREGFFFDRGGRYIDVQIRNIPREHGIASGTVFDEDHEIFQQTPFAGRSLRIQVHRGLTDKTATPMHELFHLFQYACCHFNNMWFMEGLARWSQSIVQVNPGKEEPLPSNCDDLDTLVHKKHDAEFFWNRLASLCETGKTFLAPDSLQSNSEIYNSRKTGSRFIASLLENCNRQMTVMQRELRARKLDEGPYWTRQNKRSPNNNAYIFRAIVETVDQVCEKQSEELLEFISVINPWCDTSSALSNREDIQQFLGLLGKYHPDLVQQGPIGLLYSEFFDVFTRTFTCTELTFDSLEISDRELESFRAVKRITGRLTFSNCPGITNLNGLNQLSHLGALVVDNMPALTTMGGLNGLQAVTANLQITNCARLLSVTGLNLLESISGMLSIKNCESLELIAGFSSLARVGGDLTISNCTSLERLNAFHHLASVTNIQIISTALEKLEPLANLFRSNPRFGGYIKICGNNISDVGFMSGVQHVDSSLYLHQNQLNSLQGLDELQSVGASFSLAANKLETLANLSSLREVNGLLSLTYNRLRSLHGLEALRRLATKKWGEKNITLKIYGNDQLTDISALRNIRTYDDYLILYLDDKLDYPLKPAPESEFHKNILEIHDFKTGRLIPTYTFIEKMHHDYSNFRKTTHNRRLTAIFDFETDADVLVMSFTGAYGNLGGLFYNRYPLIVDNIKTHKIFLKDPTHTWYNRGIQGLTKDMDETIAYIREIVTQKKYHKVVCMGSSMGAYLSMVMGNQIQEVHEVLAFSPQIFIGKEIRQQFGDKRWSTLLKHLPENTREEYQDLNVLFNKCEDRRTRYQIHYATAHSLDRDHVEHLPPQENIIKISYDVDDHYLTVMLHEDKRLGDIILDTLK